jgi:hypothetical protein
MAASEVGAEDFRCYRLEKTGILLERNNVLSNFRRAF